MRIHPFIPALLAATVLFAHGALAQSLSSSTTTIQSAFVTDGTYQGNSQAGYSFGGAGTMALAGANSSNGTFESLLEFNISSDQTAFNNQFGIGNWSISSVTLTLASNVGTQGGKASNLLFPTINTGGFGLAYIPDNIWTAGTGTPGSDTTSGVTYNSLGPIVSGSENVGTYTYTPPGNNVAVTYTLSPTSDLLSEITSGTDVSMVAYPTDSNVAYLFNTATFASNHPELTVTAIAVPEPAAWGSILVGFAGMLLLRRRRRS